MKPFDVVLCLVSVVMLVSGQLVMRHTAKNFDFTHFADLVKIISHPLVYVTLLLYGVAFVLWILILSRVPLSWAYPIQALAFPLVVLLSSLLLHETVPINRWIGVGIIVIGTIIASFRV
ncbi:MAG: EamA family transporter [Defluviitaleaceae bacterium]|nr:EamA family transporter [Defluviitaleaceae bacterium]